MPKKSYIIDKKSENGSPSKQLSPCTNCGKRPTCRQICAKLNALLKDCE